MFLINRVKNKIFLNTNLVRLNNRYMSEKTGAQLVYDKLVQNGVKTVCGYSGGSIMPLIDQFHLKNNYGNIDLIINTHEQSCGHAATGISKTSNETGVIITTSGPGCTNLITPILDAQTDSTPLVVITGQVGLKNIGTDAFQEAPAVEVTKPCTKWSVLINDVKDIPFIIDKAFYIANSGKKGVVHIDLPKCISTALVDDKLLKNLEKDSYNLEKQSDFTENQYKKIENIVDVINNSKKPLLYIGQGCLEAWKELREFVNLTNIPCTSTIHGKGILNEDDELSLKWCGMHGFPAANYALQEADCIIAIGSRFDDRTTGNISGYAPVARNKKQIIHVDIEKTQFNKALNTHYNLNTTSKKFLDYCIKHVKNIDRKDWLKRINNLQKNYGFNYTQEKDGKLNTPSVINSIDKYLLDKKDYYITTGVGNHQMMTYQYITGKYPNRIQSSGSLGVMGAGLPYAIGAQIANKNSLVIDIDGDSSFMMTMNELKTIKEYNLPIKIAILNDSVQGMVNVWEELFFDKRYTATINKNNPDFCLLANSFGIKSLKCDNLADLESTTKEFLDYEGPILCEYRVNHQICLPLVGPGKNLDEMIMFDDYYKNRFDFDKDSIPS
uniref:acetolactate synthase n=1 Tax=viral metagenome TaxID=1070528 RepID=A0A6C0IWR6_9ZZZZ